MTDRQFDLRHVDFEGKRAVRGRRALALRTVLRMSPPMVPLASVHPGDGFLRWVIGRAGLDAGSYRHEPLRRRLPACLRALKVHSTDEARKLLERRPDLLPAAIAAVLIGVTEFFRDPGVFEHVRTEVLPILATRPGPLRIWSAGCSTGEELYSMAILLAEAGLLDRSFLLGTDCRTDAIERAQAASYDATALRPLEPAIRRKYFEAVGGAWRPIEVLRRRVAWRHSDLAGWVEQGPWDIILWRNMGIYLNRRQAMAIWKELAEVLAPNGFLIVGKAERPPSDTGLTAAGRCVYRIASCPPAAPATGKRRSRLAESIVGAAIPERFA